MILLNYDYYDIYALFLLIRHEPERKEFIPAIEKLAAFLETPTEENQSDFNTVRHIIKENSEDKSRLPKWVLAENVYTAGISLIKADIYHKILAVCLHELAAALEQGKERAHEAAYAFHNFPLILADYSSDKGELAAFLNEYRAKYNKDFLSAELKALEEYEKRAKEELKPTRRKLLWKK